MAYTRTQAQAFPDADGQIERQQLAELLGIHAVAAQGVKRGIEQLQSDRLEDRPMRRSLTTTGLLDPRQLAAWSSERRRVIYAAVAKGMRPGGREVRDAARSEMRSAFTLKRNSFISSMGVRVFGNKPEQLPA